MGIIYLVKMGETDFHKIGISKYESVALRLASLQTSSPYELTMLRSVEVIDARALEQDLHTKLKRYRVRGEWFQLETEKILEHFDLFINMVLTDQALADTDQSGKVPKALKEPILRQTDTELENTLRQLRSNGMTREQAREHLGYVFDNALWASVGRPSPDQSVKQ